MGLMFPKKKRVVDKEHLKRVARLQCCVCGWPDSDAHHIIGTKKGGMGYKSCGDDETIPLCRACHTELHTIGHKTWESIWGKQEDHLKRLQRMGVL